MKTARSWKPGSGVYFLAGLLVLLEAVSRAGIFSSLVFPPPSVVLVVFARNVLNGTLVSQILASLTLMITGYLLCALVMIPLGVLIGGSRHASNFFGATIEFLRPLPPPAIIPIVILFLGIGDGMRVFVVFFTCSFPVITNTFDAIKRVPRLYILSGMALGLNRWELFTKIMIPAAAPGIVSGLKTAMPIAIVITVLAEMVGSIRGIGHYMLLKQRTFEVAEMYAAVIALGLLGYLFNRIFHFLDRTYFGWYSGWKKVTT